MLNIFCCRSRRASRAEEDNITDSLKSCLSHELGVTEFQNFLATNGLEQNTLKVFLECSRILREIDKLSPDGRVKRLPDNIQTAISGLYEMTRCINLDSAQVNASENLLSKDINKKIGAIQEVQNAAEDLLEDTYKFFRRDFLKKKLGHE